MERILHYYKDRGMFISLGAFVAMVGRFRLVTLGSLTHGGPYVAIMLNADRVGYVLFSNAKSMSYSKKHKSFDDAKKLVDVWFEDVKNYNLAANTWNSMNIGVSVQLKGEKK